MNNALSRFLENKISIELPLKHFKVYCVTYISESPRPLTIEIQPSATISELQDTRENLALESHSDAQHSHPLEGDKTLVISQLDNVKAPEQSDEYHSN
ncbi:hypothetical protein J3R82DRAFT_10191 [Butyriboletus roseoflavus]|nr:hypothetical protein J3R82DRAFT_10191 [Butyriboletus roseoflavus]